MAEREPRQALKCTAKRTNGQPCGCWAMVGQRVCRVHGGSAPQNRRAASRRVALKKAERAVARQGLMVPPGTSPLAVLEDSLGHLVQLRDRLGRCVEKLEDESLRYGSAQRGEAIRGELQMYAAILNQTVNAAEKMTKLGLAERRIELDQRIGAALIWVVANSLKDLGVDADQPQVTSVVQARLVEAGDRDEQSHAIAARKGA